MIEYWLLSLTLAAAQRQLRELDREDVSRYKRDLTRFVVWGFAGFMALDGRRDA